MILLLLLLLVPDVIGAAVSPGPDGKCGDLQVGTKLGADKIATPSASSATDCCRRCVAEPRCVAFSFQAKGSACELAAKLGTPKAKAGFTSGIVRAGPSPSPAPTPTAAEAYKRRVGLIQRGPLRIIAATPRSPDPVPVGELWELNVNLSASFDNPYNDSDVRLDANFSVAEAGQTRRFSVGGFFFTPFGQQAAQGVVGERGAPSWRVRFAPRLPGEWSVTLSARDRSGSAQLAQALSFRAVPRPAADPTRGFLRASAQQPLALEEALCPAAANHTAGRGCGFHAVGCNLQFFHTPTRKQPTDRLAYYLAFMRNLSQHGGNYLRFRVDMDYAALEAAPNLDAGFLGLGWYEEQTSWEVDAVYSEAEASGVYLQHTLYNENANLVLENAKNPAKVKNANSPFIVRPRRSILMVRWTP